LAGGVGFVTGCVGAISVKTLIMGRIDRSIGCAPQGLGHLLTISTGIVAEVIAETGGVREHIAAKENPFNNSTDRYVPENLRRSEADTGFGVRIR
jgi:hypothetical protein